MTEQEVKDWLGLGDTRWHLRAGIVAGMAEVPNPGPGATDAHVDVLLAFLRCVGDAAHVADLWEIPGMWAMPA